jgi:hypothetical protein
MRQGYAGLLWTKQFYHLAVRHWLEGDPAQPRRYSNWPDFKPVGRPRSATVAIRRKDGGLIGT